MAKVELYWQRFSTTGGGAIHPCEVKARRDRDALVLEVYDRGREVDRQYNVSAHYWLEDSQRGIPFYDEEGLRGLDDARTALTQKGVGGYVHLPVSYHDVAGGSYRTLNSSSRS